MLSCNSGTCLGDALAFSDSDGETTTVAADVSSLSIAAFIDTDESVEPDTGEPIFCHDNIDFTTSITLTGSSWGDDE